MSAAAIALALLLGASYDQASDTPPPNVLVIVADDVADRDVGRLPTPNLRTRLFDQGVRFRRAYSSPYCSPSRRMLLVGEEWTAVSGLPCQPGTYDPASEPDPHGPSLPRLFASQGYRTALFGKWHLGTGPLGAWELGPLAYGFGFWGAGVYANVDPSACPMGVPGGYTDWLRAEGGVSFRSSEYQTHAVRDGFLSWLAQGEPGAPWFAVCSFQAAHAPFELPPGYGPGFPTTRDVYEAMVREFDLAVGALVDAVDLERTFVVFLADNGTPNQALAPGRPAAKAKGTTYEDGIRVPFVIAGPGVPAGLVSTSIVSLVDVLPTMRELLGLAPLDELDGRSLLPVLVDPGATIHDHLFVGSTRLDPDLAIVTPGWKYREQNGTPFLFDLVADPQEDVNLSGSAALAELELGLAELLRARGL